MMGFLILRARPREELPRDDSVAGRFTLYFVLRKKHAYVRVRRTYTSCTDGEVQRGPGVVGRMETPACVHKHVKEPLCKFLNTMGLYILRLRRGAKNKISIATNVSRLKRPFGSDARRTSRASNCRGISSAVCPAQLRVEALMPDRNDSFSRKYDFLSPRLSFLTNLK